MEDERIRLGDLPCMRFVGLSSSLVSLCDDLLLNCCDFESSCLFAPTSWAVCAILPWAFCLSGCGLVVRLLPRRASAASPIKSSAAKMSASPMELSTRGRSSRLLF